MSERTKRWIELYEAGKTLREIAEEYGVTKQRVQQVLRKHIQLKARGCNNGPYLKQPDIDAAVEVWNRGGHWDELGLGVESAKRRVELGTGIPPHLQKWGPKPDGVRADQRACIEVRNIEMADKRREGFTIKQLCEHFGLETTMVCRILRRQGVPATWKPAVNLRKYDYEAIADDMRRGMSIREIKEKHGCSDFTVYNAIKVDKQ